MCDALIRPCRRGPVCATIFGMRPTPPALDVHVDAEVMHLDLDDSSVAFVHVYAYACEHVYVSMYGCMHVSCVCMCECMYVRRCVT